MPDKNYVINGKKYPEEEVIRIYQFWQRHSDTNNIDCAINHVRYNGSDKDLVDFVKSNSSMIRNACIEHLPLWRDLQNNTLNSFEESIFDFTLQLIDIIYYSKEGKLPS